MLFQKFRQKSILQQIQPFRDIQGWLTDSEALGLYEIASRQKTRQNIVEIGSWQGKSTYCLAKGMRSGSIFAIDPFNGDAGKDQDSAQEYAEKKGGDDLSVIFLNNMRRLGVQEKVNMMKGYSQNFHQNFSKIDVLFIDGDHSIEGCINDFSLYAHKIVPGGFIAFHDYYADRTNLGPTYVIQNMLMPDKRFQFYKQFDSLWTAKRLKA